MKSNLLFYIGAAINIFIVVLTVSNYMMSRPYMDGLTDYGRASAILIPVGFLLLIGVAFSLKWMGKMLAANIIMWIPALPMGIILLFTAGFALLFILFGN